MFRILLTSVSVPIVVILLLDAGCAKSAEERARLAAVGESLHGTWQGVSHTFVFRADGTFEHEEILEDSVMVQMLRTRKGRWEIAADDGGVLRVRLICKSKDCRGYWVQKDAEVTNTWSTLFRVQNDRVLYCDDSWKDGPWSELKRVSQASQQDR